jgi:hypothetical protein
MSFPLETYSIAAKIATTLNLKEFRIFDGIGLQMGGYSDAKLISLLIIACRLGFDLEGSPAWKEWATATEEEEEKDQGDVFNDSGETDILGMTDEKLDEYLDWVQMGWIDEDDGSSGILLSILKG